MNRSWRQAIVGALLLAAPAAPAQDEAARVREEIEVARRLIEQGRRDLSAERIESLRREAAAEPAEVRARVELSAGDLFAAEVVDAGSPEHAEAIAAYRRAIEVGTPEQAAVARNNIGSLHYATGRWQAAIDAFASVDLEAVPEDERFVYRLNLGRALEAGGREAEALDAYLAAVRLEPVHAESVRGAAALLFSGGVGGEEQAVELGRHLLAAGQLGALDHVLAATIERWRTPETWALVAARQAAGPERPFALPPAAAASPRGRELERLLSGRPAEAGTESPYREWSADPRTAAAIAELLLVHGDLARRAGDTAAARERYWAAWRTDESRRIETAQKLAVVLADGTADDEARRLLAAVSAGLDALSPGSDEERRALLAARLLLADALPTPSDDRRRQLGLALELERELRAAGEPPIRGLHHRLAELSLARGDDSRELHHRLLAAQGAMERGDLLGAGEDLAQAAAAAGDLPPAGDAVPAGAGSPELAERYRLAAAEYERRLFRAGAPRLVAATAAAEPLAVAGGKLCLCGRFPAPEQATLLRIEPFASPDAAPVRFELERVERGGVIVRLPTDLEPGRYVASLSGPLRALPGRQAFEAIAVGGEGPGELGAGQRGRATLSIVGTRQRVRLRVTNHSPEIVGLSGGDEQVVATSGGSPNRVELELTGRRPGPLRLEWEALLPSCSCLE